MYKAKNNNISKSYFKLFGRPSAGKNIQLRVNKHPSVVEYFFFFTAVVEYYFYYTEQQSKLVN